MKYFSSLLFICLCLLLPAQASAQIPDFNQGDAFPQQEEPDFLPVDDAFVFDFQQNDDELTLNFTIADDYYLYKHQFKLVGKDVELGEPVFPEGKEKEDEFFGLTEVYYHNVSFTVPVNQAKEDGVVKVRFQGCADAGLCYPPTVKVIYLSAVGDTEPAVQDSAPSEATGEAVKSEQFGLAERLADKDNLPVTLLLFLALGIGLAFTPCVFPMYPILSGIVLGQGGVQFQAALQHPAILGVFIVLFIALAMAMFGVYEIQLPSSWQSKLNDVSNNQKRGNFAGVFVMGVLSGLVASPCTTAPLTGILLFIAQTGDMTLGFISLYVLSLGMGIPLILFGMTGGKLLPKAGNWMNVVKVSFGFMMLAVAILFIERLWSSSWTNLLKAAS